MNRYISSFLIAIFLYSILIVIYIYSIKNTKIQKSTKEKNEQSIKFTVIQQQIIKIKPKPKIIKRSKIKSKPIVKPKSKIIKKQKTKVIKKLKPKAIKKQKKIIKTKSKPIKKQNTIVKPKPKPKLIKTQIKKTKFSSQITTNKINTQQTRIAQKQFYDKLKRIINKNKSYPKKAIKRDIQGVVKVSFIINSNGNVKDIQIISGKRVFKKSVIKAIKNSFPIEVDSLLFLFPKKFTIKLSFILN